MKRGIGSSGEEQNHGGRPSKTRKFDLLDRNWGAKKTIEVNKTSLKYSPLPLPQPLAPYPSLKLQKQLPSQSLPVPQKVPQSQS